MTCKTASGSLSYDHMSALQRIRGVSPTAQDSWTVRQSVEGSAVEDSTSSAPSSTPLRNSFADAPNDLASWGSFAAPKRRSTTARTISTSGPPIFRMKASIIKSPSGRSCRSYRGRSIIPNYTAKLFMNAHEQSISVRTKSVYLSGRRACGTRLAWLRRWFGRGTDR